MAVEESASAGAIRVELLGPRLVLTTLEGRTTRAHADAGWVSFKALVSGIRAPVWLSDAARLTAFEPSTLTLGARWFATFREQGGKDCLVVSRWPVAMMAASTMALGLGVRVRNYADLEEARRAALALLQGGA